jgi:hypothetical protein
VLVVGAVVDGVVGVVVDDGVDGVDVVDGGVADGVVGGVVLGAVGVSDVLVVGESVVVPGTIFSAALDALSYVFSTLSGSLWRFFSTRLSTLSLALPAMSRALSRKLMARNLPHQETRPTGHDTPVPPMPQ